MIISSFDLLDDRIKDEHIFKWREINDEGHVPDSGGTLSLASGDDGIH